MLIYWLITLSKAHLLNRQVFAKDKEWIVPPLWRHEFIRGISKGNVGLRYRALRDKLTRPTILSNLTGFQNLSGLVSCFKSFLIYNPCSYCVFQFYKPRRT